MGAVSKIASVFRMTDEVWKRHANPWSVWTRFGAIPLMILAIWSRVWLGRWCLVPIAAVIVWLWLNPRVFAPVENPTGWAAKGIYGEKLWLNGPAAGPGRLPSRAAVPDRGRRPGLRDPGFGLIMLEVWPTVFIASLIVLGQLWRIDRLGLLFEEQRPE